MNPENPSQALATDNGPSANDDLPADPSAPVLSNEECALFAQFARLRPVVAGEPLFDRSEAGGTMFVIQSGSVQLDFGDDLVMKVLGPNEFFGELGLLIGDHQRSASAVAATDGLLLELEHPELQGLVERDPSMLAHFLRRVIVRVVSNEQNLIHRLRRRNQELQAALDSLRVTSHRLDRSEELNRTDDLTELYNRRGLSLYVEQMRANGGFQGYGLMLVDCDRFKNINDAYGHLLGDRVLQSVANILRSLTGSHDIACRLGGDEFCVLLRASSRDEMLRFADFVVTTARALLEMQPSPPLICPLSVGACLIDADRDWNDWYALADKALYRAKRSGGNRVEWQD